MDKQNMAYRVGEQVPNHLDKEATINQDVTHTTVSGQLTKKHLALGFKCAC